MPEPIEPTDAPSQMSDLAAQLKAQNDKALGLPSGDDGLHRLEEAFKAAKIENTPVIAGADGSLPAPAPKGDKPDDKTNDAKPDTKPSLASRLTSKAKEKGGDKPADKKGDETDDRFVEPEGLQEKSRARFHKLADGLKAAEAKLKEYEPQLAKVKDYETEIATLKAAPKPDVKLTAQLEALQKERDELDAALQRVSVEHHPKFREAFDDKIEKLTTSVKNVVGDKHRASLNLILNDPDTDEAREAYATIKEDIGEFRANQLIVSTTRLHELRAERAKELENWKTNAAAAAKVDKQKALETEQTRLAEREVSLKKTLAEITSDDSDLYVFRRLEGEADWNKGVEARLSDFQKFATKDLTPADQVELSKRAASAAGYAVLLADAMEQITAMADELEGIRKATPGFRGTGAPGTAKEPENESYSDRVVRLAKEAGAFPNH